MNGPKHNSVRNLENLYTVVVGLALSVAIYQFVGINRGVSPIRFELAPFLVAFILTLLPFYHGALRHLDVTYIEHSGRQVRSGALLADFSILFIEGCLLLALAFLISVPQHFAWGLVMLLSINVIWGFIAHLGFSQEMKPKAESRWALINLFTVGTLVIYFFAIDIFPPKVGVIELSFSVFILVVSFVRTVLDYMFCWEFYYPST
jgi:hypothetical protein